VGNSPWEEKGAYSCLLQYFIHTGFPLEKKHDASKLFRRTGINTGKRGGVLRNTKLESSFQKKKSQNRVEFFFARTNPMWMRYSLHSMYSMTGRPT
jgi:hypothetical protein